MRSGTPVSKTRLVACAVTFKVLSAIIGAVSYCWQMNFSQWLLYNRFRSIPFSWDLFSYYPTGALIAGALMGYFSALIVILWCRQFYRTASFISFAVSSWCIGIGFLYICFALLEMRLPIPARLMEVAKQLMVCGMPFFWGLILQYCARRLRELPARIET
jgi:hypothetical protein